jgi:peptidoglycan/LPS O-acetylase OafA/YrhL
VGALRLLLALAVVVAHASPPFGIPLFEMTGGPLAVQIFYVISGFYMALILNRKYLGEGAFTAFVPQAWTVGVELMFYAVAPFIVRRRPWVVASLMAASLLLRVYIMRRWQLFHDPWTYRFFPTELLLFLAGALSYRLHERSSPPPFARRPTGCRRSCW